MKLLVAIVLLVSLIGCSKDETAPKTGSIEEKRIKQGLPRNIDLFNGGLLTPDLGFGKSKLLSVHSCDFTRPVGDQKVEIACNVSGSPQAFGTLYYSVYDRGAVLIDEGPTLGPDIKPAGESLVRMVVPMNGIAMYLSLR